MKLKQSPCLYIDADAMERIWQWTALAKGEFSCLAMVSGDLFVHGVELFDQVCTSSNTELDQQALAKFLCKHEAPELVRAWVHSHGSLGVFWSEQDEDCIAGLANESFLVSIVVNKRHELRCRLDLFHPVRITIDELALEVRAPSKHLKAECAELFKRHVDEMPPMVMRSPQLWPGQPVQQQQQPLLHHVVQGWPMYDDDDQCEWRAR